MLSLSEFCFFNYMFSYNRYSINLDFSSWDCLNEAYEFYKLSTLNIIAISCGHKGGILWRVAVSEFKHLLFRGWRCLLLLSIIWCYPAYCWYRFLWTLGTWRLRILCLGKISNRLSINGKFEGGFLIRLIFHKMILEKY